MRACLRGISTMFPGQPRNANWTICLLNFSSSLIALLQLFFQKYSQVTFSVLDITFYLHQTIAGSVGNLMIALFLQVKKRNAIFLFFVQFFHCFFQQMIGLFILQ